MEARGRATNDALGYAIGKIYVERYFPPAEKARAEAMAANIIAAFRDRIDRLELDGAGHQAGGQGQAAVLKVGVGYPDKWPDYSGLEVKPGDAFGKPSGRSCGSCTSRWPSWTNRWTGRSG